MAKNISSNVVLLLGCALALVFCATPSYGMNATSYGVPVALQFDTPLTWFRCSTQTLTLTGLNKTDMTFTLSGAERWAYIVKPVTDNLQLGWTHMYDYQDVYTDKTFSCVLTDTTETNGCYSSQISNTGRFYTTTQLTSSKAMYFSLKRCGNVTASVDSAVLEIWVVGTAATCTAPTVTSAAAVCNPSSAHGVHVSLFFVVAALALAVLTMF